MGRESHDGFQWKVYRRTSDCDTTHSPEHKGFCLQKLETGTVFAVLKLKKKKIIIYTEIKGPGFIFQHK